MQGMEVVFGGYDVPMADKEAMLRHFSPAISEDGQIGVDRDTMMMWSAMPSTLEFVSTLYMFPFLLMLVLCYIKDARLGNVLVEHVGYWRC